MNKSHYLPIIIVALFPPKPKEFETGIKVSCVGKLLNSIGKLGGSLLITADHGNSEMMIGPDGQPWTAHTTNPVPVILIEGEKRKLSGYGNDIKLRESGGGLADLAPTLLHLLNLPKPKAMTGKTLIEPINLWRKHN